MIGMSMPLVRGIEQVKSIGLSDETADKICAETAVCKKWLIDMHKEWVGTSSPKCKPVDAKGRLYTLKTFERHRAALEVDLNPSFTEMAKYISLNQTMLRAVQGVAAILEDLSDKDFVLFSYKLSNALAGLKQEFGASEKIEKILESPDLKERNKKFTNALRDISVIHRACYFHHSNIDTQSLITKTQSK